MIGRAMDSEQEWTFEPVSWRSLQYCTFLTHVRASRHCVTRFSLGIFEVKWNMFGYIWSSSSQSSLECQPSVLELLVRWWLQLLHRCWTPVGTTSLTLEQWTTLYLRNTLSTEESLWKDWPPWFQVRIDIKRPWYDIFSRLQFNYLVSLKWSPKLFCILQF